MMPRGEVYNLVMAQVSYSAVVTSGQFVQGITIRLLVPVSWRVGIEPREGRSPDQQPAIFVICYSRVYIHPGKTP